MRAESDKLRLKNPLHDGTRLQRLRSTRRGGFIRIEKFDAKADGYLESILPSLENPTSYTRSKQIICHLVDDGVISKDEGNLLSAATCDKALTAPQHVADVIRSNILKETIIQILKR